MNVRLPLLAGLTATAFVFTNFAPIPIDGFGVAGAFAKGGNGNGHGGAGNNGNGGHNGNSAGGGKRAGDGGGRSANDGSGGGKPHVQGASAGGDHSPVGGASSHGSKDRAAGPQAIAVAGKKGADAKAAKADATRKTLASKHGAFRATDANLRAFIDASPASRAGRIVVYAQALVAREGASTALPSAEQTLAAAKTALTDAINLRDAALRELLAAYADVDPGALQDTRNALANDLLNSDNSSEIDRINAKLAAIDKTLAAAATFATAACALDDATAALAEAQSNADAARHAVDDALTAAANRRPVDAEAKAYLDDELRQDGILDYYRSLSSSSSSSE